MRAFRAVLPLYGEKEFMIRVLHLLPLNTPMPPMMLATSLPISEREDLEEIAKLYSARWTIETFFLNYKQAFRVSRFRVHSSWEALDRLLSMAHMAYLTLCLLFEFSIKTIDQELRLLRE